MYKKLPAARWTAPPGGSHRENGDNFSEKGSDGCGFGSGKKLVHQNQPDEPVSVSQRELSVTVSNERRASERNLAPDLSKVN